MAGAEGEAAGQQHGDIVGLGDGQETSQLGQRTPVRNIRGCGSGLV